MEALKITLESKQSISAKESVISRKIFFKPAFHLLLRVAVLIMVE